MAEAFRYVIIGGGVAAGYAAWEFVLTGLQPGELAIITKEAVAPYERPALSKGYFNPQGAARLPGFHTCVNMGGATERHGPEWYAKHGITLILQTEVVGGDLVEKELTLSDNEMIKFEKLIIATGSMVTGLKLKDGSTLLADLVVVGVGAKPCTHLFPKQLDLEQGGYKVNGKLETSIPDVYAVGDVATFPVKLYGNEIQNPTGHVRHARTSGKYVVQSIRAQEEGIDIDDYDYTPYFYSKMLDMNWQCFGKNAGDCVVWGLANVTPAGGKFGAYWVMGGKVVGAFLESGSPHEYEALSRLVRQQPRVTDLKKMEEDGISYALNVVTSQIVT